ncbi:MAG: thioredoxin [Methylomicrobium sp.]|nr:thioredoxin [Methylomicrobium sp.]
MRFDPPRFFLIIFLLTLLNQTVTAKTDPELVMDVFWGQTCPHCLDQKPFLSELEERYPQLQIRQHEVWRNRFNRELFQLTAREHGVEAGSVPAVFVDGKAFFGDAPFIRKQIEDAVRASLNRKQQPDDRLTKTLAPESQTDREMPTNAATTIDVPWLGTVDLVRQPLIFSTLLIAFVDGFNPCSLWVLTLLLGMVIHSGSRKRMLLVGLVFLFTTATLYGAFVAGVFKVLSYVAYLTWVQWLVALFALLFGLVNVKDYFWFKKGISFTISDKHKPGIYQSIRGLLNPERKGLALAGATFVMASGIALVELPCTAGFPVIWSQLVRSQQVGTMEFLGLLLLYLLIYLSIEIIIFLTALITLKRQKFEEKHGQTLKLIGGMIMIALGIVMIVAPDMMNDLTGTLIVFSAALFAAAVIMLVQKMRTDTE